ncbi:hypothetical protein [Streptomyces sp. P17]|uniref:hypothetical protein n=1 Tax=Streptomyces sp. P17 TaxID=3074716 RepID=UPI0028F444B5|nr:hypothetical protein [Streptomyces sp. P17]MDT9695191.1 hypothetical protein [Streptomyces sp. P17]
MDVRTPEGDHVNVCERGDIDAGGQDSVDALLTPVERRELLGHRCLVRTPDDVAALADTAERRQEYHFPFEWRLS